MDNEKLHAKKIGWIGTGVMGESMCSHIMKLGYTTYVHNRTKNKTTSLMSNGAIWCDTPKEVTEKADIIFTIVGYPVDVENVYFSENGILSAAQPGKIFIDMTTTKPSLAQKISTEAKKHACKSIDAPVSGGDVGAREARLAIMAGGERETFDYILPLFEAMGKNIVYEGTAGSGQHTKMCNQITIAGTMIGVCEALLYGYKAGLDIPIMLDTISKGAAGCWSLDNLATRIAAGNFAPGFYVEHFIKDMGIALEEAGKMEIALPGLALVHQLYVGLKAAGHGKSGTQALILALDNLAGNSVLKK